MKLFIITAVIFTLILGSFFGMIFTDGMHGRKRTITAIILSILIGCTVSGMFYLEKSEDEKRWNNGYCDCGTKWQFGNVEHTKTDKLYYWHCSSCGRIIELHMQFQ